MNITMLRIRAAAVLVLGGLGAWVPYGALADTMEMEPNKVFRTQGIRRQTPE